MGESTLTGTEFGRLNTNEGTYNIAWVGSYTYTQDVVANTTTLTLYGSMYTDSSTNVRSANSTDVFKVNGVTISPPTPSAYRYSSSLEYGYSVNRYYSLFGSTTLTVTHNANGTFPNTTVSLYAKSYHHNNLSGTYTISGLPTIDRTAPTVSASVAYTSATAVTLSATSNVNCNKWEYQIGSGAWTTFSTTNGTSASVSITVSSTSTVTVRATKTSNQVTNTASVSVDRSAPTVSIELTSRTSSSLTVKATANRTCNVWEYSTNNGSSYTQFSTSSGTSATATISGLSNNTSYSVRIRARATNYIQGASSTGSYSTLDASAPVVTISLSSRTSSSLTIAATADTTCNKWEYSINDGSSFTQFSTTSATSVSYTITGLSPNTTYNVKVRANKASNNVKGTSARGAYTTLGQAIINSAQEIYADAATVQLKINVTIYSSTFTYSLLLKRGNTTLVSNTIAAQSVGTKDITITLSSNQRNNLLSGMSDVASFTATYNFFTFDNGTQIGSVSSTTATVKTSSSTSAPAQPTFNYADIEAGTVAITGDSSKLIQGQSYLRLTNVSATAKNGAGIASYSITIGGSTVSSTSGGTINIGAVSQSGSLTLTVTAKDTRGYTSSKSVTVTCYAYAYPSLTSYAVGRDANTSTQIDISASGTYSNIGNNTVTLKYKYKKTSAGSYGTEVSVTPTRSGSTFSYSANNIATFDEDSTYNFVITVQDGIQSAIYNLVVPTFTPLIAYRPNAVGFGAVPQGTKRVEIAQDWRFVANGKNNQFAYMPYSWFTIVGYGQSTGYARVATISIVSTVQEVIHIRGTRRVDMSPFDLYIEIDGNFALRSFYMDYPTILSGYPFSAFIYSPSTNVWDVYVQKAVQNDCITVSVEMGAWSQQDCSVVFSDNLLTSVPSGAVMATPAPYVLGMNNARSLLFQIPANGSKTITGSSECAWLLGCTGWNSTMRRGLWWISGYSDSSRADVIYLLGNYTNSQITITAVSGSLAWTISNTGTTTALMSCLAMYGNLPTVT